MGNWFAKHDDYESFSAPSRDVEYAVYTKDEWDRKEALKRQASLDLMSVCTGITKLTQLSLQNHFVAADYADRDPAIETYSDRV